MTKKQKIALFTVGAACAVAGGLCVYYVLKKRGALLEEDFSAEEESGEDAPAADTAPAGDAGEDEAEEETVEDA